MGILSSVWTANVLASKLYRYKNSEGNIVIDHRIPFEYMAKGYEILTSDGRLIEVVSPQTEDDSVDQKDDAVAAKARAREDKFILSSYSTVEEIDQAKKRKLTQLDREINLVKSNLADTRKQREQEQVRAADYQRGGKAVPEAIRKVLVELDIQEGKAEKSLASREKEIVAVNTLYTRYKKRYIKLTEPPSKSLTEIRAESELNGSSE
jgi:hypothetical protein